MPENTDRPAGLRRSWFQRLVIGAGVALCLACLCGAGGLAYGLWRLDQFQRFEVQLSEAPPAGDPQNYLVVGSDSRDNIDEDDPDAGAFLEGEFGGRRSDTMMVVRVDPQTEAISVLSIPRDLWVPIQPDGHSQRINTAYAGGPQQVVDTVESYFRIPIHHYVEIDFVAFKGLVDTLGGVPMWFDRGMQDTNTGLFVPSPGCVVLDGTDALAFARSRHLEVLDDDGSWSADPTGDLGRITRQQVFLRRAMDQAATLGLSDLLTVNRLLGVATDNVSLDAGLDVTEMARTIQGFATFEGDAIATYTLPTSNWRTPQGAAVLLLDEAGAQSSLNPFRGIPNDPVDVADVTVSVLNGTGLPGQAGEVADALESLGYDIGEVGDAESDTFARTTIRYAPGQAAGADRVARQLTAGADLVEDPAATGVVLVTGADFSTIMEIPRPPSGEVVDDAPSSTTVGAAADVTDTTAGGAESASGGADGDTAEAATAATTPATAPSTTTTTVIGYAPTDPPPGTSCT
ncbi:MAG: LCP family protein [Actinomycetota bacterium]|nr:LCP family protein [Actinomycetota bacterium]